MTDLETHEEVERQVAVLRDALGEYCPEPYLTIALGNYRRVVWELEMLSDATREEVCGVMDAIQEFGA